MAGQKDFIDIIRSIRGSAAPGQPLTDGIWYELTVADKNGNPGVYGDILAKYGIVTESAGTFDQAVAILENLNVEVTTLPAGSNATSALVNGVWQIGLPRGTDGTDGNDGNTPELTMTYDAGNIKYTVTVDGVIVTNTNLINLDTLVDSKVSTNVGVQETLEAKQDVLDAVATAQGISDSLDANVVAKKQEIATYTNSKINEIGTQAELEKTELSTHATIKVNEYNANALNKLNQYNDNHTNKLSVYNANNTLKLNQYNENHIERLSEINYAYADRIIEMIKTRNFMGIMDEYVAKTDTHMITFLDTTDANYIYYANGTLLVENVDYTVYNNTTIELTVKANPYDVIVQVNTQVLNDMLMAEGALFEDRLGQPNGVASLDVSGKVPAEQLPSYVDDVIEVNTYADLPVVGESNKIYSVVTDETSNEDTTTYRWTGTVYAVVSNTLNASDVKALYEANPDTNVYTDAEKSRIDINTDLTTAAQTLPTAVNEIDNRLANIEDNTTLAEYGIIDAYTKTEVQETLPAVGLDTTNTVAPTRPGQIKWNQNEGTADLVLNNGVTLQLGQENTRLVRNATLAIIPNMTVCMFDGTLGNSGRIKVAPFTGLFDQAQYVYGIATQSINAGKDGYITIDGKVRNVNTTGAAVGETWLDGDILYVKPNNAGHLTKVVPKDDELKMPIASVIHAHVNGTLEVRVLPFNENMIAKRANKWTTARTIALTGDVSGSTTFDGSGNVTLVAAVSNNSHTHSISTITGLGTAATMDVGTSDSDIPLNNSKSFLWAGRYTNYISESGTAILDMPIGSQGYLRASDSDFTQGGHAVIFGGYNNGDRTVVQYPNRINQDFIIRAARTEGWTTPSLKIGHSGNIKQTTGTSTEFPMSQKAVTDVITAGDSTAVKLTGNQTIAGIKTFSSNVVGNITGNAATATKLQTARNIALSGDVTGSVNFDGSGNVSITTTVADDSHNHIISNVDGLQAALDSKADKSDTYTKLETEQYVQQMLADSGNDVYIGSYGLEWNETTDTYRRIGAVNYTAIQSMMRRCVLNSDGSVNYYLDKNNSNLKEDGTLANLDGIDGNVMVEVPKTYVMYEYTTTGGAGTDTVHRWEISLEPETGFEPHWAFDRGGSIRSKRYYPAYQGYVNGGKLISRSGVYPTTNVTLPTFRGYSKANSVTNPSTGETPNGYWSNIDFALYELITLLCVIEYGTMNIQSALGQGRTALTGGTWVGSSLIGVTGLSNGYGNRTANYTYAGSADDANADLSFMSYRGCENFFGNVWRMVDGVIFKGTTNNKTMMYSTNPASYNNDATGYTNSGIVTASAAGYGRKLGNTNKGFIITDVTGGNSNAGTTDYYYTSATDNTLALVGSNSAYGLPAGPLNLSVRNSAASLSSLDVGCGVSF